MSLLTSLFRLIPPSFKAGYCPKTVQQLANDIISGTQVTFLIQSGNFLYNYGSATPTADNRIFPWLRTTDGLWYTFQFGFWVAPYPVPADPNVIWLYTGTNDAAGLWVFDGGDGTDPTGVPPTPTTGSFWQVKTELAARFPVGVGTLPSTTTIAIGGTGGEEKHSLTLDEMPPHTHPFTVIAFNSASGGSGSLTGGVYNSSDPVNGDGKFSGTTENAGGVSNGATPPVYTVSPHNTMPPYYGVFFIKRTARQFKTLPA